MINRKELILMLGNECLITTVERDLIKSHLKALDKLANVQVICRSYEIELKDNVGYQVKELLRRLV